MGGAGLCVNLNLVIFERLFVTVLLTASDFYEIVKSCIIEILLGVLGQMSDVKNGSNIKIQKHYL